MSELPDRTPIDVLMLHTGRVPGWGRRFWKLRLAYGCKTLGDLRKKGNAELLSLPSIGTKMLRELRRFATPTSGAWNLE